MKHFIGPSNYSTYHSYTQAQARPIQLPDVGSIMSAVGHVNRANEAAEDRIKAAQEKAEAEAAKQAANAESHRRVYGPVTNQAVGNGYSSDRGGTYETPPVGYYRPFGNSNSPQTPVATADPFEQPTAPVSQPMTSTQQPVGWGQQPVGWGRMYSNPNMTTPQEAKFGPFGSMGGF